MDAEATVDIVTQPPALSKSNAIGRVESHPLSRLKGLFSTVEPVQASLRYKPYYRFDVVLTKRVFRGEDIVREGQIVVDGMTDIARPFTEEAIDVKERAVDTGEVLEPTVPEEDALVTARSRRMQVEHREKGIVDMDDEPTLVYKPVWLVELASGEVRVVDATDGSVFTETLIG